MNVCHRGRLKHPYTDLYRDTCELINRLQNIYKRIRSVDEGRWVMMVWSLVIRNQ